MMSRPLFFLGNLSLELEVPFGVSAVPRLRLTVPEKDHEGQRGHLLDPVAARMFAAALVQAADEAERYQKERTR